MNIRIVACAWAAAFVLVATQQASVAVWAWGCKGQIDDQQLIFDRYSLVRLPASAPRAKLADLIHTGDLAKHTGASASFESNSSNGGFEKEIEFTQNDDADEKLILAEKSSRRIKASRKRVGPRDEFETFFKKTYRVTRAGGPPRDIRLECMEYLLSSKGGRS